MEALGIEVGSSFSSFSDNESFGELDASFTQHDQIFSTKEPTTTASTDNARSDVDIPSFFFLIYRLNYLKSY